MWKLDYSSISWDELMICKILLRPGILSFCAVRDAQKNGVVHSNC